MSGREGRLKTIRKIIIEKKISSQEDLLKQLDEEGLKITQATLSRDLKALKVGKVPDEESGYYYALSETDGEPLRGYTEDFRRGYLSIAFSENLGVIKTLVGHANSVAIALDKLELPEILGTIAGDDTILVVIREEIKRGTFIAALENVMGDLEAIQ